MKYITGNDDKITFKVDNIFCNSPSNFYMRDLLARK